MATYGSNVHITDTGADMAPTKAPEMEMALSDLDKAICLLDECTRALEARLSGVCVPVEAEKPRNELAKETRIHSPVVDRIYFLTNRLRDMGRFVSSITSRLEV